MAERLRPHGIRAGGVDGRGRAARRCAAGRGCARSLPWPWHPAPPPRRPCPRPPRRERQTGLHARAAETAEIPAALGRRGRVRAGVERPGSRARAPLEPLSASRSMRGNENPVFGEGSRSHIQGWRRQAHALCVCCARSSRCDARATTGSVVQCVCVDQGLALCRALATGQGWRGRARVGPADLRVTGTFGAAAAAAAVWLGHVGAARGAAGGGRSAGAGGERETAVRASVNAASGSSGLGKEIARVGRLLSLA